MRKPCYLTHFVIYLTVILTTSSTSSEISTSGPLLSPVGYARLYLKLLCKVLPYFFGLIFPKLTTPLQAGLPI